MQRGYLVSPSPSCWRAQKKVPLRCLSLPSMFSFHVFFQLLNEVHKDNAPPSMTARAEPGVLRQCGDANLGSWVCNPTFSSSSPIGLTTQPSQPLPSLPIPSSLPLAFKGSLTLVVTLSCTPYPTPTPLSTPASATLSEIKLCSILHLSLRARSVVSSRHSACLMTGAQ